MWALLHLSKATPPADTHVSWCRQTTTTYIFCPAQLVEVPLQRTHRDQDPVHYKIKHEKKKSNTSSIIILTTQGQVNSVLNRVHVSISGLGRGGDVGHLCNQPQRLDGWKMNGGAERGERWGSARREHAMITHGDCGLGHAEKERRCGDQRTRQAIIQPKVMSSYSWGGRLNKLVLHDRTGHCHSVTMSSGTMSNNDCTLAFRAVARSTTHSHWARRPALWPRARTEARTATLPW